MSASALFVGHVVHARLRPKPHRLRYRAFWMLLDLDEIDAVAARLRLFSRNRFSLFAFHDRDHGEGSARPLREQIDERLKAAGISPCEGPVRLLTMPRVLGFGFNPLSVYFCHRADGGLGAIVYQVHNTFGERHSYVLAVTSAGTEDVAQNCPKVFYVSPFMAMDITYQFNVQPPDERVHVGVDGHDKDGPVIFASLSGERRELTDASLARAFLAIPLLTFKVVAAIHWEALLLWLKGVPLQARALASRLPRSPRHGNG